MVRILPYAIALACTASVSCIFHAGDTCKDDACLANGAPTARIRGVDAEGNLRVGARSVVLISAADSTDPNEDELTYAWSVGADCASQVLGATDGVELELDGLAPDQACDVTLTVSDGTADGTATASLIVRDVGAYVSTAAPCAAGYDPASDAAQGTIENPFCRLPDALLAAADYQLALVSVDAVGEHALSEPLAINRSVTIRGGFVRSTTGWASSVARSEIALGPGATVSVAGGAAADTAKLESLYIFRTAACTADCALIDATGTSVAASNVNLGTSPRPGVAINAASATSIYYSVRATGVTGRELLSLDNVSIRGASTALASVGVAVIERFNANLVNSVITEKTRNATGVKLLRAGNVSISGANIAVESDAMTANDARDPTSIALGVRDGNTGTLDLGGCTAGENETCGSSASVSITASRISALNARLAVAVMALGTRTLSLTSTSFDSRTQLLASGRQAAGIVTMNTGDVSSETSGLNATRVDIDVTGSSSPGLPVSYAIGWSDGYELGQPQVTNAAVGLGSYGAVVSDMQVDVRAGSDNIGEVSGVVLRDSRKTAITSLTARLGSIGAALPANGYTAARVAGVRLARAANVTLNAGSVTFANILASWIVAGLIDGQMTLDNDDIAFDASDVSYGSALVDVNNLQFFGPLAVRKTPSGIPLRTCIGLFGTNGARILSQAVTCTLGVSEMEPDPSMAAIITLLTREVSIVDSTMRLQASAVTAAVRLVGVQDGSRLADNRGSTGLRIARNVIALDARSRLSAGLRLSGGYDSLTPASRTATVIDNNAISIAQSEANIGMLIYATPATVAFNNVRIASCSVPGCNNAWATAFYLMHPRRTSPVSLLGNAYSVLDDSFADGNPEGTPLVVEHAADTNIGVAAVVDNVHGIEQAGSTAGLYTRFVETNVGDLRSPEGETSLEESALAGVTSAQGNVSAAPVYCFDGIHGDPTGPQAGVVQHVSAAMIDVQNLRDIDGEARTPGSGDDAGADKLNVCPFM